MINFINIFILDCKNRLNQKVFKPANYYNHYGTVLPVYNTRDCKQNYERFPNRHSGHFSPIRLSKKTLILVKSIKIFYNYLFYCILKDDENYETVMDTDV